MESHIVVEKRDSNVAQKDKRRCPKCKTEVGVTTHLCPKCHHVFHWERSSVNSWVRYLQSPYKPQLLLVALVMAVIGQFCMLLTSDILHQFIPLSPIAIRIAGHLVKGAGEVVLLSALAFGLKFESYRLTSVTTSLVVFCVAYHLLAAFWPYVYLHLFIQPFTTCYYWTVVLSAVAFEVSYFVLGISLYSRYNGNLSRVGLLLIIRALLFLLLNVVMKLSGHNLLVDITVTLLTWVCFYFVWEMLLDHRSYMDIPSSRLEQA